MEDIFCRQHSEQQAQHQTVQRRQHGDGQRLQRGAADEFHFGEVKMEQFPEDRSNIRYAGEQFQPRDVQKYQADNGKDGNRNQKHGGRPILLDAVCPQLTQAVSQLRATSTALAELKKEMLRLAESLPEYPVVQKMYGTGPTLGPQLMAEIGDARRFHSKKALVAFAGIDAPPNDSGQIAGNHKAMSKIGSSALRRTLFLIMGVYLQNAPVDEPVYQFMDRKRAEGKPYRVYMMASANKFLRIYYATVKAYLDALETA